MLPAMPHSTLVWRVDFRRVRHFGEDAHELRVFKYEHANKSIASPAHNVRASAVDESARS
jgi:hypothetical protein